MTAVELALIVGGSVITILLTVIGFFLARIVSSVQTNTEHIGKNKGSIELVKQKQEQDTKRIEEMTQLEIKTMAKGISELTGELKSHSMSVNKLVMALAVKGIEGDGES